MSRQLVHDLTYDAPAERVTAMLADPAFREEVCDFIQAVRRSRGRSSRSARACR